MLKYQVNKLSDHITAIVDATQVSAFLVEGKTGAVLIDTGIGITGLKEEAAKLTDKHVDVLLTHGHGDHAGGCQAFDSVYVNPLDLPVITAHGMEMRVGYTEMMLNMFEQFGMPHQDFDPASDMVPVPEADKEYKALEDGMVFDLGGIHVEIIGAGGHTKGSVMMLFPEDRLILFGDACNPNTLVGFEESTSITTYLNNLKRIKAAYEDRYDRVMFSHGGPFGPKTCLDDNIELCERILAGTDDKVEEMSMGTKGYVAAKRNERYERLDGKCGNIFYTDATKNG